jgi:hypothetical protein
VTHYLTSTGEAVPVGWWSDARPLRFDAKWLGRGLHLEIGTRAYLALARSTDADEEKDGR